ncbi:DUF1877 family protein, partial [Kitasatospora cinereorecta]
MATSLASNADSPDRPEQGQQTRVANHKGVNFRRLTRGQYSATVDNAIHRSLTDGYLGYDNGTYPLNAAILGGVQLHEGDDYIVSLLTPDRVRDVADAMAGVGREALKAGYDCIDI